MKIQLSINPNQVEWVRREGEIVGARINLSMFHIFENGELHQLYHIEDKNAKG